MLQWMEKGEFQITSGNVDQYLTEIKELAQRYNLLLIADQFRRCLEQR